MTDYREFLILNSLRLNNTEIAKSCGYSRNTVTAILQQAQNCGFKWPLPDTFSDKHLAEMIYPTAPEKPSFKMPDHKYVYRELQKNGVTLNLL